MVWRSEAPSTYFYVSGTTESVVPSVAHVAPANNAVNVPLNAVIRLTFNRTIETPTIDPQTVTLKLGATPIPYTVVSTTNSDDSFAIVLRPAGALPANATIQVGVTNGVKDDAGHAVTPFSSSFTTSSTPDFSTPLVVATTTINGVTNVPLTSVYSVTFDRPMNTRSFKLGANIYLQDNFTGAVVPSTMSFSGDLTQVTLAPLATLAVNRNYSAVWAGQLDFAENSAGFDSRQFTTALQAPIGGPVVVLHTPQTGDTNVPVNFMPAIRFDRPVMRTSVTAITFTRSGVPVPYVPSFESGDTFVRLVPSAILQPNSSYVLTITGVKDTGGTAMAGSTAVTFTTAPTIDLISPVTLASSPENNRITGTNPVIRFRVNEPIDPLRSTGAYLQNVVSGRLVNGFSTVFSADRRTDHYHLSRVARSNDTVSRVRAQPLRSRRQLRRHAVRGVLDSARRRPDAAGGLECDAAGRRCRCAVKREDRRQDERGDGPHVADHWGDDTHASGRWNRADCH